MGPDSVNMHFHGTNTSPVCHQDEVIHTLINSGETFTYDVKFPNDEPPGLYWYHPHVHGIANAAVQGGASGAIVVEGLEKVQPAVAGLAQRIFVIRDQNVAGMPPPGGPNDVPSWDLTLNYVPDSFSRVHAGDRQNQAAAKNSSGGSSTHAPIRNWISNSNTMGSRRRWRWSASMAFPSDLRTARGRARS